MKKKLIALIVLTLCFAVCVFASCEMSGGKKVTSVDIVEGSVATEVVQGEELNVGSVRAIVTYSDGSTKEIGFGDLKFDVINTDETGEKYVEVTYKPTGYKFNFAYTVVEKGEENEDDEIILLYSALVSEFNTNRSERKDESGKILEEINFAVDDEPLYVGSGNRFDFRIVAKATDEEGDDYIVVDPETEVTVEMADESGEYAALGDDLNEYVAITEKGGYLDFTEKAEGNKFRVSVKAKNADTEYAEDMWSFVTELSVVEGFNIYDAEDLAIIDNLADRDRKYNPSSSSAQYHVRRHEDYKTVQQRFMEKYGVTSVDTTAVILQNDMKVTAKTACARDVYYNDDADRYDGGYAAYLEDRNAEIPEEVKEKLIGTPVDRSYEGVYHRVMHNGEKFELIGNYFSLDASEFPKMVMSTSGEYVLGGDDYSTMVSHLQLFYFENEATNAVDASVCFKNVNLYGNAERNSKPENSGGTMLAKANSVNFRAFNTITHNFYMIYLFETDNITDPSLKMNFSIESSKGYDSYQCLLYFFGVNNVVIKDSVFKRSGGPAVIADLVERSSYPDSVTYIDVVNSFIESSVSGQEPWFDSIPGAKALAATLVNLQALFNTAPADEKTVYSNVVGNTPQINAAIIMKSSSAEGLTGSRIKGKVRIFGSDEEYADGNGTNYQTGLNFDTSGGAADIAYGRTSLTGNKPTLVMESSQSGVAVNAPFIAALSSDGVKFYNPQTMAELSFDEVSYCMQPQVVDGNPVGFVNGKTGYYDGDAFVETGDLVSGGYAMAASDTSFLVNGYYFNGDYVNVYLPNGMGVMMRLYPSENA